MGEREKGTCQAGYYIGNSGEYEEGCDDKLCKSLRARSHHSSLEYDRSRRRQEAAKITAAHEIETAALRAEIARLNGLLDMALAAFKKVELR